MALPHPLPDDLVELIARRFRVIGEPMRIRLLDRLREGEATVGRARRGARRIAAERLQAPRRAGRRRHVGRRKEGNHVYYRIVDESVFALCEQVCGAVQQQLRALNELVEGVSADGRLAARAGAVRPRGIDDAPERAPAALVTPWFLLLTRFVGLNQWLFVGAGWCPASLLLERGVGIEQGCRR